SRASETGISTDGGASAPPLRFALEKLLELHGVAHVALDAQLPGHECGRGVLLAVDDPQESVLGRGDRRVGLAVAFGDARPAVLDADDPLAGPVDVEQISRVQAVGLRRARGPCLERLEELANVLGRHAATLTQGATGSTRSRREGRVDGSSAVRTSATAAAPAATYIAARRAIESATAPSATAPTPP